MPGQTLETTLWDLAEAVYEEVEKVFVEEPIVGKVSNVVLRHLILTCVKNIHVTDAGGVAGLRGDYAES